MEADVLEQTPEVITLRIQVFWVKVPGLKPEAMLAPEKVLNPALPDVVDVSHVYAYTPDPPVGLVPVMSTGLNPSQTFCAVEMVFEPIAGTTVITTGSE